MSLVQEDVIVVKELLVKRALGPSSATPVTIGTATTSHSLASNADLLVSGILEINGAAHFDGAATAYAGLIVASGQVIEQNAALSGGIMLRNLSQTPDAPCILTGTLSNSWIMCEEGDKAFDFAHAQATNPTLFIHSADQVTTDWISFNHDGTDGNIDTGAGTLNLGATGNVNFAGATHTGTGDTATNGYVEMEVAGATVKFATVA